MIRPEQPRIDVDTGGEREVTARGLAPEVWRPLLAARPEPPAVTAGESVTVVVPHPDDETLGAGGLLHRLSAEGARIRAIFVTDGAAGYPDCTAAQASVLAMIRRREVSDALATLGLERPQVVFLDIPDGTVGAAETQFAAGLLPFLADSTICLAPWPDDPHPDHQAVGRAAVTAARQAGARLWQYPIWMRHSIRPDDPIVDVARLRVMRLSAAEAAVKRAAIETHASQLRSPFAGYGPVLPAHVLELFADGLEPFFLPDPPASAGPR